MHLIIDGKAKTNLLEDRDLIYRFLDRCPDAIGMKKIAPPYVFSYYGEVKKDWGVTGFVLIAESHISIHTFPEHGLINIDVFSCKDFDTSEIFKYIASVFRMQDFDSTVLKRGLK